MIDVCLLYAYTLRQIYDEAIKLSRERQGPLNPTLSRLYFNKAIVYEDEAMQTSDTNTYGLAYDHYKKAFVVSREVLGIEHSKTLKFRDVLRQPTYAWFAGRRHENIDSLVSEEVLGTA